MDKKTLLFVPYQDTDNFYEDGILTREFAILSLLYNLSFSNVINIKKPRTILDKRRYLVNENYYPNGSIECTVKNICDSATTIQYLPIFKLSQIIERRNWWKKGFENTIRLIPWDYLDGALVYSDNPYAVELLRECKRKGMRIYFDVMDNFAIHPSLSAQEQKGALEAYVDIMTFADIVSANSVQTCDFMMKKTSREPILVKNGVFPLDENIKIIKSPLSNELDRIKRNYTKCVGYIGKLGLRLDAELIDHVTRECKDILFVFVGPFLKGQISERFQRLIMQRDNIVHFDSISSAYVYPTIEKFDICMLPHSVGKAENGGDPLKLYQYMSTNKPIISTRILGVDEFSDVIKISNSAEEWIEFLEDDPKYVIRNVNSFTWGERFNTIAEKISNLKW